MIRQKTQGIENAIAKSGKEIELLREYRTRLIADVVTGKLDVREAAAKLPDEGGEPEVEDETEPLAGENGAEAEESDPVPEEVEA